MHEPSPFYSFLQLCLLAAPFVLVWVGVVTWKMLRQSNPALAWFALLVPVMLFTGVGATTYSKHQARKSFLSSLIVIPERIEPGRVLAITMYGESSAGAYHLVRTGVANEVLTALEDGHNWRHDGTSSELNLGAVDLYYVKGYGEITAPFKGTFNDIDYVYVTGHLADFIELSPFEWGALEKMGYDQGLVSLIYDVSDGWPINLAETKPIFRFASTRSVYFRLPNWSTHWSLEKVLDWESFTPPPLVGNTRFDILAERVRPLK